LNSPVDKNVFIDTSVFIANNYSYDNPIFKALLEYISQDKVQVILTSVTVQEVKSHIEKDTERTVVAIKKARAEARILRNIPNHPISQIFTDFDAKLLRQTLTKQFDDFLNAARVIIVPVDEADIQKVFDLYFKREAPFGEGKKKSEFPDAFVLSALNKWCESDSEKACVISTDADMKEGVTSFPCLIHLNTLEEFIIPLCLQNGTNPRPIG
jgi:predicted nucleic acid-binding protein